MIADGENVADLLPSGARYVHLAEKASVGQKRNIGCDAARGELIAHWDDDDYSAPGRLSEQVERLLATGKSVTGYNAMRFTDGHRWWQYRGAKHYALGTSLVYRRDFWSAHRFPSLQVGEDNHMVGAARAAGAIVSVDAGDMMFATIHAQNTSPRQLKGDNWREI